MNCREAKTELALMAGQELDEPARIEQVRRHLVNCPACRVHQRRLKQALSALEQSETLPTYEVRGSIWPELSTRLGTPRIRTSPLKSWLPMVSFVAACVLLIAVLRVDPPAHHANGIAVPRGGMPDLSKISQQAARGLHDDQKQSESREANQSHKP